MDRPGLRPFRALFITGLFGETLADCHPSFLKSVFAWIKQRQDFVWMVVSITAVRAFVGLENKQFIWLPSACGLHQVDFLTAAFA
jgi:hypothetical protein